LIHGKKIVVHKGVKINK